MPKKGQKRKGEAPGARLAYDDTPDSAEHEDAAATRKKGVTTKKGMARKGKVAGSRLAFDDTKKERKRSPWIDHVKAVQKEKKCSFKEAMTLGKDSWKK
jgi:hypothetical protein